MNFRDLKRQYEIHSKEINAAISDVLRDASYIGGKQVENLEDKLASYVGVTNCIACANGTDALELALMTWGIGEGDAVFVPDFTFFSTAEVVALRGATPVFVDIEDNGFNISASSLEFAICRTIDDGKLVPKAIIAVDLFGHPADFDSIKSIANKYNLLILEDGAQGFGGEMKGERACSFGDISTTSFFPAKPLGCYGDGGAVFTDNSEWAELIRSYHVHGKGTDKYDNVRIGMNSRLDSLQAAILNAKFAFWAKDELDAVDLVAGKYGSLLNGIVDIPLVKTGYKSSWAQYSILLKDSDERSRVQDSLKKQGVPSMIYYKKPMHEQKAFAGITGTTPVPLDRTTDVCSRILSLPMHPYLTDEEIEFVASIIRMTI